MFGKLRHHSERAEWELGAPQKVGWRPRLCGTASSVSTCVNARQWPGSLSGLGLMDSCQRLNALAAGHTFVLFEVCVHHA
jgi:hypothetical protein